MILSNDQLKQLAVISPEVQEWLEAHPAPGPTDASFAETICNVMTQVDMQIAETYGPSEDGIVEEDVEITLRDGMSSMQRVFRSATAKTDGSPLFVWIFGGAWVGGSRFQSTARARHLVKLFGAVVVSISYRLAPEHTFPTAPQDCWDHLKWIASNAKSLGADPRAGFIVGGVSAGANMTAVMVRRAQAEESLHHAITGQWLEVPLLFGNKDVVPEKYRPLWLSREHCLHSPLMNTAGIDATGETVQWDPASPWFTPVAYQKSLEGIPPTYLHVDGTDPLRDDALVYDELLRTDGVRTRVDLYPGCPHAHGTFLTGSDIAHKAQIDSMIAAGWLLGTEITAEEVEAAAPSVRIV